MTTTTKVSTLEAAAAEVPDGATVAIGGLSMNSAPMAFVRELARRGVKDLTLVAIVSGLPVDWLVAAGCVRTVVSGLVSFEGFGLAPHFRRAVEAGEVAYEEYSEHTLMCRFQAAGHRLPFVPTRAGLGTDMVGTHPDTTRVETDPVTGQPYVACTPLPIDVAVVHAHAADEAGNVRMNPKLLWLDSEPVKAASRVIVTVERIVPHREFVAEPEHTTFPRFAVDRVIPAPWGAYPTSLYPTYTHDHRFFEEYATAARNGESWSQFWKGRVLGPEDQASFLDANGGSGTLLRIRRTPA